jgi:N-formylglutamate amidohydrolase/glutamine amidotransferase-like uncharacterized protein
MQLRTYRSFIVLLLLPSALSLPTATLGQTTSADGSSRTVPSDRELSEQRVAELVDVENGDLPIILSAPHGGREKIPGVPARHGDGIAKFVSQSDVYTRQLAGNLADAIENKLGRRPYLVMARFHRRYLDANRPKKLAYESEQAANVYQAYHQALARARRDVLRRWGYGILLDIHGQGSAPQVIFRGTQNGKTTTRLINRYGPEALIGESSLFGQLSRQGFQVHPPVGSQDPEHGSYDGGFIVRTYGSSRDGALDAIQLEFGRSLRAPEVNMQTADKLAEAITAFAGDYLPATELIAAESVWVDDFSDGDRSGWFELDDASSSLSVIEKSTQLNTAPELQFAALETSSLQSAAAHFPAIELERVGDMVSLQFDARHSHSEFINRGFRFGLFDSDGSRFSRDGDLSTNDASLDDEGFFAIVDVGSSTTLDSAILRQSTATGDPRLWSGKTLAADSNQGGRDPLMFTRDKSYTYTLTLTRWSDDELRIELENQVGGSEGALTAVVKSPATLRFDTVYFGWRGSEAAVAIDNVIVSDRALASTRSPGPSVRVGVYMDEGAGPSVKDLLFLLAKSERVSIKRLSAKQIVVGQTEGLDLLIHPGGSGGKQGRHLGEPGREAIRTFVREGGGFIGICAGAYLASADYSWSLDLLDAKVLDRKHWNRGKGTVEISFTETGRDLFKGKGRSLEIFYGQGPLLAPGDRPDIEDYRVLARFETEIAENGAAKGVMPGTTAIATGRFGRGRVLCFSPHPEMTAGLESLLYDAINEVKRKRQDSSVLRVE